MTIGRRLAVGTVGQGSRTILAAVMLALAAGISGPTAPARGDEVRTVPLEPAQIYPAGQRRHEVSLRSLDLSPGRNRLSPDCPGLLQPGQCVTELEPSGATEIAVHKELDTGLIEYRENQPVPPDLLGRAGYWANWKFSGYIQTGLLFDLSEINRYPNKFINQAVLKFHETLFDIDNRDQYGNQLGYRTCTNGIGKVTVDWGADTIIRPLANDPIESLHLRNQLGGVVINGYHAWVTRHEFYVTQAVQNWLAFPAQNYGLVIMGENETFPENDEVCVGFVGGRGFGPPELTVEYTVLDPPPPTPTPRIFERPGVEAPPAISASHRPHLVVTNLYTKSRGPGQPFGCGPGANTFVAVIKNQGPLDAGPFSIDLLIQGNANPAFHTRAVAGLASGQEMTIEFPPTVVGTGAQLVRVTVDSTNAIDELDETKNFLEGRCTV